MKKEVNRYVKEFVEKDRAFENYIQSPTINLDKVSHMITKLEEDGNNFMGRVTKNFINTEWRDCKESYK